MSSLSCQAPGKILSKLPVKISASTVSKDNFQEVAQKVQQLQRADNNNKATKAHVVHSKAVSTTASHTHPNLNVESALKNVGSKKTTINTPLFKVAKPIKSIILEGLTETELTKFEIAIGKGTSLSSIYRPEFDHFHPIIIEIRQKRILQDILADHPTWQNQVASWKNVSIEDKIWLLRLYELYELDVKLPQIDALYSKDLERSKRIPCERTPQLLENRKKIEKRLAKIEEIDWSCSSLKKCPDAICLLINLKKLSISRSELVKPPELRWNVHLQELKLRENKLTKPPVLNWNVKLQVLDLAQNQLTKPPVVSKNPDLSFLDLTCNNLTMSPDIRRNLSLRTLLLTYNSLIMPPDISQNALLESLYLRDNQITNEAKLHLASMLKERPKLDLLY